jgi:hypothetical protein
MLRRVVWQKFANVSEERTASIFIAEEYAREAASGVSRLPSSFVKATGHPYLHLNPENEGNTFLRNVSILYQTTRRHIPEENIFHKSLPREKQILVRIFVFGRFTRCRL